MRTTILLLTILLIGCRHYRKDSPKYIEKKQALDGPVLIAGSKTRTNTLGGVDLYVYFENISKKRIKYIRYVAIPYNQVGDIVRCSITGKGYAVLNDTGPHEPGVYNFSEWEAVWFNHSVASVKIVKISVIYMDNKKEVFKGKSLDKVMVKLPNQKYDDYYGWPR